MKTRIILAGAVLLASAPSAAASINLVCRGAAEVDQSTSTIGRFGVITTEGRASIDDTVGVRIGDGNDGEARLPRRMLPAVKTDNHDGWFPLIHVEQAADEITAQVRLNQYNKPRIRLDRITGAIRIDGPTGDFSGQCEAYDPQKVERKF